MTVDTILTIAELLELTFTLIYSNLIIEQVGSDTVINDGAGNSITRSNYSENDIASIGFVFGG